MKKSYINIVREIEKMRADGLDDDTIQYALQAKYNESNIEHIYTQANWEQENNPVNPFFIKPYSSLIRFSEIILS